LKKLILIIIIGLLIVTEANAVDYGPFDKIKTLSIAKGKCISGDMCVFKIEKQDAQYFLVWSEKHQVSMITKQLKSKGKKVTLTCDMQQQNHYGIIEGEFGKRTKIEWSSAWDIAYEWLREIERSE